MMLPRYLVVLLIAILVSFSESKITKPAQYETEEDMAKWEKNAVKDIVKAVPTPDHRDLDDSDDEDGDDHEEHHYSDVDGDEDGDEHSSNAHAGGVDGDDKKLAGDVAEQGRLWNELTQMEKDADKMVQNSKNQQGPQFQTAENDLFDGAVRALHDVDMIDTDIQKETDQKKKSSSFGPSSQSSQLQSVQRHKSTPDWMITAFFLGALCILMSGGAYVMFRKKIKIPFPRDEPVDSVFDGESAPYQL